MARVKPADVEQPQVADLKYWERADFLPADTGLPWMTAAHAKHAAALTEFGKAVTAAVDLRHSIETTTKSWRRALRDAVASGDEPPARPSEVAVDQARIEVFEEDAVTARERLAEVAVEVLNELRKHLAELQPHLGKGASPELVCALGVGSHGSLTEKARADLRKQLAELSREEPIPDVTDGDPYETEDADAHLANAS